MESAAVLALLMSLCFVFTESVLEVETIQGEDCTLQCTAHSKPGVLYRAVRWYKDGESSGLNGLLTKDLPNGTTRWYVGVEREVELLGETQDIFLPNVTCADRGMYTCHLAAPVGEQNQEGQVLLKLRDCPGESKTENPLTDTYLVISATVVLMLALVIFLISYGSLKNIIRDRSKTPKKQTLLESPFKPLNQKDLQSIYTLGPKVSRKTDFIV
ncbi:CD83 antigen-like [Anoplopoma fimbria]|uniref:CD83 antigen-like n=1 Tax=Anoplopoma fimbria TaxID=229290 RepID=UPI0023EB7C7A|nr:CD83 antigen-like [Anoplopoma fimbria]